MNKKLTFFVSTVLAVSLAFPLAATAAEVSSRASTTQDVPIGGSGAMMEMIGKIEPTIMSVTMPSFVPFDISNSMVGQNKVLSPRIEVRNNSTVPVKVDVIYTRVDLSKMSGTTWSDNGTVKDNQIAIGFKEEEELNTMPQDLSHTQWLVANRSQDTNVMILDSNEKNAMYVVGTLGSKVSENNTFSVIPTFVVSRTSNLSE